MFRFVALYSAADTVIGVRSCVVGPHGAWIAVQVAAVDLLRGSWGLQLICEALGLGR